jgi:dihydrofolate synthase / folylpolyglutamate synthase
LGPIHAAPPTLLDPAASPHARALDFLASRIDYERMRRMPYGERELKLDRMRALLDRLGNPERGLPILHVAGTKGKGSTAAMLGSVLRAAGFRSGVFSSPHLERVEERFAINGLHATPDELVEMVEAVRPACEAMDRAACSSGGVALGPTFFEVTTAMALEHFARRRCDVAVLEVGMGGRLDSTNVCSPMVAIITSISHDHTNQLGSTLEAIAGEKAGIVKPGVPVVSGVVEPAARDVIRRRCRELGCRLVELGTDFEFRYAPPGGVEQAEGLGRMDFLLPPGGTDAPPRYAGLPLRLLGSHQAANAAVALAALEELQRLGWAIPEAAVRAGLAEVVCPARVEIVARRPVVVLDAAHNVASIDALLATLDESFSAARRLLIFATTEEKDVRGMLASLLGRFDEVIFTRYRNNPRGVPAEELQALAAELSGRTWPVRATPAEAWDLAARTAGPDDLICVTGSFFIAAEMRRQWMPPP